MLDDGAAASGGWGRGAAWTPGSHQLARQNPEIRTDSSLVNSLLLLISDSLPKPNLKITSDSVGVLLVCVAVTWR